MLRIYVMVILILLSSSLSLLQTEDEEDIEATLKNDLALGDTCTHLPCLFGESVQNMDFDNVHRLIGGSNLRDSMILLEPNDGGIIWIWSSETAPTFGINYYPEVLGRDDYERIVSVGAGSGIQFYDGQVDTVHLYFITELDVLVTLYGEPLFVVPRNYDYYGNMDFLVSFPDVEGYFIARTRCEESKLTETTRIVGHLSTASQPYISNNVIEWQGYTDELPNCTIFQP